MKHSSTQNLVASSHIDRMSTEPGELLPFHSYLEDDLRETIINMRLSKTVSQRELARRLAKLTGRSKSQGYVSQLEKGIRPISYSCLEAIAQAFNLQAWELVKRAYELRLDKGRSKTDVASEALARLTEQIATQSDDVT